jgi:DNA repair exonuclease SbcCD ATPase subunit
MKTISNSDDVIDSRDVISRLEELQDEREELKNKLDEWDEEHDWDEEQELEEKEQEDWGVGALEKDEAKEKLRDERQKLIDDLQEWDDDNGEELESLKDLNGEGENASSDWRHGETLIRESYFTDYCEELCKDVGDLPREIPHYIVIDWEATANNIKADYTSIDFDGETYYVRSS